MLPLLDEYILLLQFPGLVGRFLFNASDGWLKVFEAWNVTYTAVSLFVAIVQFFMFVVFTFGLGTLFIPFVIGSLFTSVIGSWVSWYCIVKQKGCCGSVGFILWGLFFLSAALAELEYDREHDASLGMYITSAIKAVPASAMALSCFMAVGNPGPAGILGREAARSLADEKPQMLQKCAAECLGTFLLVFTVGSNVLTSQSTWGGISIASVLMVMIYSLGGISGAHFNPAVSLAVFGSRMLGGVGIDAATMASYWVAQGVGGALAGVTCKLMYGAAGMTFQVPAGFSLWQAGCCELLYTCMLCFVVLNTAISKRNSGNQYYGLAIGFVVAAGAYGAGAVSMGCFNPAVALGLLTTGGGKQHTFLAYCCFEGVGAMAAVILFAFVRGEDFGRKDDRMPQRALSEFIGTFFLVLTVGLNVMAFSEAAAFSIAAALMSMIYALGSASGAHFNPAVSMAILVSGGDKSFGVPEFGVYVASQAMGGIFGGLTYSQIYMDHSAEGEEPTLDSFALGPQGSYLLSQALTAEVVYTFVLAFVVLSVAVSKRTKSAEMFGLAIGMCVTVGGVAVGSVSGASLNPAVSLGIGFSHAIHAGGTLTNAILYSSVEIFAGLLAAVVFKVTHMDASKYSLLADNDVA